MEIMNFAQIMKKYRKGHLRPTKGMDIVEYRGYEVGISTRLPAFVPPPTSPNRLLPLPSQDSAQQTRTHPTTTPLSSRSRVCR